MYPPKKRRPKWANTIRHFFVLLFTYLLAVCVLILLTLAIYRVLSVPRNLSIIPLKALAAPLPLPLPLVPAPVVTATSLLSPKAWVSQESLKYGINPDLSLCIIQHESQWQSNRIGDIGNPNGESFGPWQIELKKHPDVTEAMAMSLQSSTDWALQKIKEGHVAWWSTFSQKPFYCAAIPVKVESTD